MTDGYDYPVFLAFGFLFFAGYVARTIFLSLRLPGVVGVIVVGILFSAFIQSDVLQARDTLQEGAFFLVLLKAGLEISLQDVSVATLVLAWLPITFELLALAVYALVVFEYTVIEALLLGTVLSGLGEGLVIPKMNELGRAFPDHPLPRLVFTCAPLEASYVLTIFGILSGFAKPAGEKEVPIGLIVVANVLRIAFTLLAGALIGAMSGMLIPRRSRVKVWGRQVFTGAPVESFLMVLAIALVSFGLGMNDDAGPPLIPMGFASGSVFSPELLVIVFGACFAAWVNADDLHEAEAILGGVWVFGQIVLFTMLGSKTTAEPFRKFPTVLPLMLTGFVFRAIGVRLSVLATRPWRVCSAGCEACKAANARSDLPDTAFCFISVLPRATLQGALASVPLAKHFFSHSGASGHDAAHLMADAGKIYIPLLSIIGSILIDVFGPRLLRVSAAWARRHEEADVAARVHWDDGWKQRFRSPSYRSDSSFLCPRSPGPCARIDPLNSLEAYITDDFRSPRSRAGTDHSRGIVLCPSPSQHGVGSWSLG